MSGTDKDRQDNLPPRVTELKEDELDQIHGGGYALSKATTTGSTG